MTPSQMFTDWLNGGTVLLRAVLFVAVPGLIALGAFFWAGRLVLDKLFGGLNPVEYFNSDNRRFRRDGY